MSPPLIAIFMGGKGGTQSGTERRAGPDNPWHTNLPKQYQQPGGITHHRVLTNRARASSKSSSAELPRPHKAVEDFFFIVQTLSAAVGGVYTALPWGHGQWEHKAAAAGSFLNLAHTHGLSAGQSDSSFHIRFRARTKTCAEPQKPSLPRSFFFRDARHTSC